MSLTKTKVMIAGMTYTLVSDSEEKDLEQIASYVDKKIKEIDNDKLTFDMQLVLASINITDELFKLAVEYKKLENNSKEPVEKYPQLLKEFEKLKVENEKIKQEYERNNIEFVKSVEETESLNRKITELSSQIDRQEKINESKDQDLKKSRALIKDLQTKLSNLEKENEVLKRDI
ncbi:MAG: cell division protein ZapA [Peptoniphilaceae bacterium]|nr:cell division protein ZapA [Peptoniphilaceae bacterium]MDY6018456.1 cell division protein ZapA [Anaerococcus sp.]